MKNTLLRSVLLTLFCCVLLAACAESCGRQDMQEMDDTSSEPVETAGEAGGEIDASVDPNDIDLVEPAELDMSQPAFGLNVDEIELPDYGWRLKWFGSNDVSQEPDADVTLRFAAGELAGHSGCNRFSGSYEVAADGAVEVGDIASTRMACQEPAMTTEQRFLGALRATTRYEFKPDGLYLHDAAGNWLHFYPEPREME